MYDVLVDKHNPNAMSRGCCDPLELSLHFSTRPFLSVNSHLRGLSCHECIFALLRDTCLSSELSRCSRCNTAKVDNIIGLSVYKARAENGVTDS